MFDPKLEEEQNEDDFRTCTELIFHMNDSGPNYETWQKVLREYRKRAILRWTQS